MINLIQRDQNLVLPNGDVLICRYPEGDCDTIDASTPDMDSLKRAMYAARECGHIDLNSYMATLPNGDTFLF